MIHISTQRGHSDDDNQALYKAIHDKLTATVFAPDDISTPTRDSETALLTTASLNTSPADYQHSTPPGWI